MVPVVLADFQRVVMSPPCPQDELKQIQVHFMTIAQSAKHGIASDDERRELGRVIEERMARYGASSRHIAARQVGVLHSDFVTHDPGATGSKKLYGDLRVATGEQLDARMALFEQTACAVLERIYVDGAAQPDGIVHATCSGYVSPSPVQVFLSRRGWLNTDVTHSYHMGCYGAFPAVRTALGLVGSSYSSLPTPKKRVDIVHTEFLSLHFDLLGETPDAFVTSTLFADGFIKYSAYPQAEFCKTGGRGLRVLSFEERILPDSLPEMTLRPGPLQFDMSLSKRVPFLIRDSIGGVRAVAQPASGRGLRARERPDGLCDPSRRSGDPQSDPHPSWHRRVADRPQPQGAPRKWQHGIGDRSAHLGADRRFGTKFRSGRRS